MLKKCKVVMLSTNEKAPIIHTTDANNLYLATDERMIGKHIGKVNNSEYVNLFILSDDPICDGDYFYAFETNEVLKCKKSYEEYDHYYDINNNCHVVADPFVYKKIIATTDSSLNLPKPSHSFIKKYVERNGIDKINVVYFNHNHPELGVVDCTPKIQNNTISIKPIEKKVYSEEDVEYLLKTAYNQGYSDHMIKGEVDSERVISILMS